MHQFTAKKYTIGMEIRKKFLFFSWKKTVNLTFGKAKIIDKIEFDLIKTDEDWYFWLINFIKYSSNGLTKSDYKFIYNNFQEISVHLRQVILDTFLKIDEPPVVLPEDKKEGEDSPFSSWIAGLCKELCENPHTLIQNYTMEEAIYLSEGISRNGNSITTEGQAKNKKKGQMMRSKTILSEQKEKIDNFLKD